MNHKENLMVVGQRLVNGELPEGFAFYMDRFLIKRDYRGKFPAYVASVIGRKSFTCGTAGCAIGLYWILFPPAKDGDLVVIDWDSDGTPVSIMGESPGQYNDNAYWAIANYFGISIGDSRFLFDPNEYEDEFPTEGVVGQRILDYCESH